MPARQAQDWLAIDSLCIPAVSAGIPAEHMHSTLLDRLKLYAAAMVVKVLRQSSSDSFTIWISSTQRGKNASPTRNQHAER